MDGRSQVNPLSVRRGAPDRQWMKSAASMARRGASEPSSRVRGGCFMPSLEPECYLIFLILHMDKYYALDHMKIKNRFRLFDLYF